MSKPSTPAASVSGAASAKSASTVTKTVSKEKRKHMGTGTKVVLTTVIGVPILMIGGMKWGIRLIE